jgi:hypothetical protein
MIDPPDLFHPPPAPHFKTFQVFLIYCPKPSVGINTMGMAHLKSIGYVLSLVTSFDSGYSLDDKTVRQNIKHVAV